MKIFVLMPHLHLITSQYIFDERLGNHRDILIAGIVLMLLLAYTFFINMPRCYVDKRGRRQNSFRTGTGVLVFLGLIWCAVLHEYLLYKRIQDHAATVIGVILTKQWKSKYGWTYDYRFQVNGKLYERYRTYAAHDNERINARVDSCFLVIYNAKDPDEAIMDLHAPLHCAQRSAQ